MSELDFSQYTILVVDDEDALRTAMVIDFRRKGFNVLDANSSQSAFELVQKNKVDLILSDMRMPGGDGMSLLEKIRLEHPKLPVLIFVTGFSDLSDDHCIAKGAVGVITKPFDRNVLMASVVNALETA